MRVFSETDILMAKVVEKLNLPIPPFILRTRLVVKVETQAEDRHHITATRVDTDGTPMIFLHSVRLEGTRRVARAEPFVIPICEFLQAGSQLKLNLEFMGHYNEPNLELIQEYNEETLYLLEFHVQSEEWTIVKEKGLADATESLVIKK